MIDLAAIVHRLLAAEQAHFRAAVLDAGMTEAYADDPGNVLQPDRGASFGHARLAALLEEA